MSSEKDATVPHGDYYWGRRLIGPAMMKDREIKTSESPIHWDFPALEN